MLWFESDVFSESLTSRKSLKTVDCHAVVSPFVSCPATSSISKMSDATLRVPQISVNNYRSSLEWSQSGKIEGIDMGAETPRAIGIAYEATMNLSTAELGGYRPDITLRNIRPENGFYYYYCGYKCHAASHLHESFTGMMVVPENQSLTANSLTFDISPERIDNKVMHYDDYERRSSILVRGSLNTTYSVAHFRDGAGTDYSAGWTFFTIPFTVRVGDIVADGHDYPWVIRSYDGAKRAAGLLEETWVQLTADSLLQPGRGYIFQCKSTKPEWFYMPAYVFGRDRLASTDTRYLTSDDIDVSLSAYPSPMPEQAGWNLIGNPYPSYYDIAYSTLKSPFMVYNKNDQIYEAYNPLDDDYVLTPGQGFFVQSQQEAEMSKLTFFKEGRQNCSCKRSSALLAPPSPLSAEAIREAAASEASQTAGAVAGSSKQQRTKWEIVLEDAATGNIMDKTRVVYNADAQMGYESSCDAPKFMSMDPDRPQLWTVNDGTRCSINERPENDGWVSLGIYTSNDGKFTLRLPENAEYKAIIEDIKTGVKTVVTDKEGLTVTLTAGTTDNGYRVSLYSEATDIQEVETCEASGIIYNLSGQKATENYNGIVIRNGQKIKK